MSPKVSVLIPTYNRLAWLKEAVGTVLDQGVDLELLILDNGCVDATWPYLEELAAREARVRIFRRDVNDGYEGYPTLMEQAAGDYVNLFSDDDHMLPGSLARRARFLDDHPGASLVFSPVRAMDAEGQDQGEAVMGRLFGEDRASGAVTFESLILGDYLPMPTVLFRRDNLKFLSVFRDRTYHTAVDWAFWLRVMETGDAGYLREPTVRLRFHRGQESAGGIRSETLIKAQMSIWKGWMLDHEPPYVPSGEAWGHIQANLTNVVNQTYGPDPVRIREALEALEAIRTEQNARLVEAWKTAQKSHPEAFLYEPDWQGAEWVEVVLSYLEAFAAGDPVALILTLEGGTGLQTQEGAQGAILDMISCTGRQAFPDIILLEPGDSLLTTLRGFSRMQWVPKGKGNTEGLWGPNGVRFAQARKRITGP